MGTSWWPLFLIIGSNLVYQSSSRCASKDAQPFAALAVVYTNAASGSPKTLDLPEGCQARAIIGPFRGTLQSGESFTAEPALTYGFLLEKH